MALKQLIAMQRKHSKMENLNYSELKMQSYLKSDESSIQQKKIIVKEKTKTPAHYVTCILTTKKWHFNAQKLENISKWRAA